MCRRVTNQEQIKLGERFGEGLASGPPAMAVEVL